MEDQLQPAVPSPQAPPAPEQEPDPKDPNEAREVSKWLKENRDFLKEQYVPRAKKMLAWYELEPDLTDKKLNQTDRTGWTQVNRPYADVSQSVSEVAVPDPKPLAYPASRWFAPDGSPVPEQVPGALDGVKGAEMMRQAVRHVVKSSNLSRSAIAAITEGHSTGMGFVVVSTQPGTRIPTFIRVPFDDAVWDTTCQDFYDTARFGRKVVRKLDEVKSDPTLNARKSDVTAVKLDEKKYGKREEEYAVLWHIYDREDDRQYLIPQDQDFDLWDGKTLSEDYRLDVEEDRYPLDLPVAAYVDEPLLTRSWGTGIVAPLEDQYRLIDKLRTRQSQTVDASRQKWWASKGALDDQNKKVLESRVEGAIVETKQALTSQNFGEIPLGQVNPDVYKLQEGLDADINLIRPSGAANVTQGVGQAPDTLGQAQIINQATQNRMGFRRDRAFAFYARIFRLTGQVIQQHWFERFSFLSGDDPSQEDSWSSFDPAKIQGKYAFELDPESVSDNSAVYRRQYAEAISTVSPFLQPVAPGAPAPAQASPSLATLIRGYLQTFDTMKNSVDQIVPEAWTVPQTGVPGIPGQGSGGDGFQQLMALPDDALLKAAKDPRFLDTVNSLPDNEKQQLEARLRQASGQGGQAEQSLPQGNSSVPPQVTA